MKFHTCWPVVDDAGFALAIAVSAPCAQQLLSIESFVEFLWRLLC
jgi:hypothetical protein